MHLNKHTGINREDALAGLTKEKLEAKKVFNVRHFGATGDGVANDAPAINKAISACSDAGGGTVFLPSGIYAGGSIHLKSNICLVSGCRSNIKIFTWLNGSLGTKFK